MYLPPHFQEHDRKEIAELIKQFPLATLVCFLDGEFIANHIPLLHDKDDTYIGHIAKANPLHTLFPNGTKAIAIFHAGDSYISPNWYPTKLDTHRHVPTWNYQVVHVHGQLVFDDSKKQKLSTVGKLTKMHERKHSGDQEWKISDAPRDYMEDMLDHIVAFEFHAKKITAKSKINQNKEKADFISVADKMDDLGKVSLSKAMKRLIKDNT